MKSACFSSSVYVLLILASVPSCTTTSQETPTPRSVSTNKATVSPPSPARKPSRETSREKSPSPPAVEPGDRSVSSGSSEQAVPADDTGRNTRDREGKTLTPMDQSSDPKDIEITRQIRKALMADDTLSTMGKNIKIITIDGTATLRGPVESADERNTIFKKATAVANGKVDNQLEVTVR